VTYDGFDIQSEDMGVIFLNGTNTLYGPIYMMILMHDTTNNRICVMILSCRLGGQLFNIFQ
jgi:hypothetical protein